MASTYTIGIAIGLALLATILYLLLGENDLVRLSWVGSALGRELWSTRVGLIAATLLAFSYTHIHFSRTMFGAIATLFATLTY